MQISPSKALPLVWHGAAVDDLDTLYVQAVVRDAVTNATLNTVNLTDKGSQIFMGSVVAPHDPSQTGTGRWITVTYTVYSEATYTTASQNYARVTERYLVKQIVDAPVFGGGGGVIDYRELKKAMLDALKEIPKDPPVNYPVVLKQDFPVGEIKQAIKDAIAKIPEPPEQVDLSPALSKIDNVAKAISNLPPPTKPTDVSPVSKEVRALGELVQNLVQDAFQNQTSTFLSMLQTNIEKATQTITEEVMKGIAKQVQDGKFRLSLFGDTNPFDQTPQKKKQYLDSLAAKYQ